MQFKVGVGVLGCGIVGESVAVRLRREQDSIEKQGGVHYDLRAIAVRDVGKERAACLRRDLFSSDPHAVVQDPSIDLIVECIGGIKEAAELVELALDRGRHVVTANKDLIATQGPRLQALAYSRGVSLCYEGAVGGSIPIIRFLNDALAGDEVRAIAGVFNGTCTSILSEMEDGASYDEALARAQASGYAESDPTSDTGGRDAAHKLAVLIQRAFRLAVLSHRIRFRGIAQITLRDIARAKSLGFRIRLIAAAVRTSTGVLAEVAPLLVPEQHSFAKARGVENVAKIVARDAGLLELRGDGAGGAATASAVLGDIVSVLRAISERHHLANAARARSLQSVFEVAPFSHLLESHNGLRATPVWDDGRLYASLEQPFIASYNKNLGVA